MRTARLAVTADPLGMSPSHGRWTRRESMRCAPGASPSHGPPADRAPTPPPEAPALPRPGRTLIAHPGGPCSDIPPASGGLPEPRRRGRIASRRLPPERSAPSSGTRQGRQGRRVREQILVKRAALGRSGPSPRLAHHSPLTSYRVSPARRGAILRQTGIGCNTNATGTITYPIAIRLASRTRCKSPLFDAEWLARILFAGRGYLERGR